MSPLKRSNYTQWQFNFMQQTLTHNQCNKLTINHVHAFAFSLNILRGSLSGLVDSGFLLFAVVWAEPALWMLAVCGAQKTFWENQVKHSCLARSLRKECIHMSLNANNATKEITKWFVVHAFACQMTWDRKIAYTSQETQHSLRKMLVSRVCENRTSGDG